MKKIHIQIHIQGSSVCSIWHFKIHCYESIVPHPNIKSLSVRIELTCCEMKGFVTQKVLTSFERAWNFVLLLRVYRRVTSQHFIRQYPFIVLGGEGHYRSNESCPRTQRNDPASGRTQI